MRSITLLLVWGAFLIAVGMTALSAFWLDYDWMLLTGFGGGVGLFVLGVWLNARWRHLEQYRK
tara:strand:+ start:5532 stop:5720 length:189 start_codon:yes stop_codon:yes gene_type:complete